MSNDMFSIYKGLPISTAQTYVVEESQVIEFGKQWDPYPWHTDPASARQTFFGQLIAPGVMLDAVLIKLAHELSPRFPDDSIIGMVGADGIRYAQPARVNDELSANGVVVALEQSSSKPERAVLKIGWEVKRQDGEVVFTRTNALLVLSKYCRFS